MAGPFLYSTNTFLKKHIQTTFRGDVHYVWCSEFFDGSKLATAPSAPSSDPMDLYQRLAQDVRRGDLHSSKINEQRASFARLATEWYGKGEITEEQKEDIVFLAENSPATSFRPLLYVINRSVVISRIKPVAASKRANPLCPEFIIEDLTRAEFDTIEFPL